MPRFDEVKRADPLFPEDQPWRAEDGYLILSHRPSAYASPGASQLTTNCDNEILGGLKNWSRKSPDVRGTPGPTYTGLRRGKPGAHPRHGRGLSGIGRARALLKNKDRTRAFKRETVCHDVQPLWLSLAGIQLGLRVDFQ